MQWHPLAKRYFRIRDGFKMHALYMLRYIAGFFFYIQPRPIPSSNDAVTMRNNIDKTVNYDSVT